jgi:hypothetical protein
MKQGIVSMTTREWLPSFSMKMGTGAIILPLLIVAVVLLLVAGIIATGLRWAPLLGALVGLGTMIGGVFT